jgi:hypothetical protein
LPPASTLTDIPLGTLGSKAAVGRTLDSELTPGSDVTAGRLGNEPADCRLGSEVTDGRLGSDPAPPVEPDGPEGSDGNDDNAGSDGVEGRLGSPDDPDGPDTHTVAPVPEA